MSHLISPTIPRPMEIIRPPSTAERMHKTLRELHARLEHGARAEGKGPESLPAWHLHLPSGEVLRVKWIGTLGPFVRFVGMDDATAMLIAPEAVSITIDPIPPDSDEPRIPIGFAAPEADDE